MRNFLAGVILLAIVLLVATAFEGLICIIMMLPLAVPIVVLGTLVGYFILELGPEPPRDLGKLVIVLFALLPTMVGAEHVTKPEPLLFTCETSVVVDAPPENVWRHVVSFSDLDPPNDWLFRSGVAYPIRARIEGTGVGAVRRCEFSTGAFVEPIEVWDEPRLLRFAVTSNPAPMREWNPLFEIHPPHLEDFLVSKQGQFLLTPLPGGKTLLKGSTLYQHGLWPASYWRLRSDPIIHRIHGRVLRHVNALPPLKVVQLLGNACLSPTTLAPKGPFRPRGPKWILWFSLDSVEPHRVNSNDLVGALGAIPAAWWRTSHDVLARLMFSSRADSFSPANRLHPHYQRADSIIPGAGSLSRIVYNNHYSFTYAASVA